MMTRTAPRPLRLLEDVIAPKPKQREFLSAMHTHKYVLFGGAAGPGKALALDTPLATTTGWATMGSVQVGDYLFDEQGAPCRVVAKSPVWQDRPVYVPFGVIMCVQ